MSKAKNGTKAKVSVQKAGARKETENPQAYNGNMIAEAAYYKAEKRGFVSGYEKQDWLEAEVETEMYKNIAQH